MALTTRQTNLLVQQDWTKIYQTFQSADFTSYDFETLRKTMIDYLRINYPEDFNDFTDSSEYIALIDLIAFMGQSLAFRADLNARENFIDTAQRQDSVFKLARLVGYSPKRNVASQGVLKIDNVSTTETVYDSNGSDLTNVVVSWNDTSNDNWQEQMNAILNAAMVNTQTVGKPGSTATINNIKTDTYSLSIVPGQTPVYGFSATVENKTMNFEAVSAATTNKSYIYEDSPYPRGLFNFVYQNDNLGNNSVNTGFFLFFKQGVLNKIDFGLTDSIPNRSVAVNFSGINNSDTWLYGVNAQGVVNQTWTPTASIAGTNVAYKQTSDRYVYQINTRANDQLDLVFGDGVFANIPRGNFTFYYRQSNGLNYKITPNEINKITVPIPYVSRTGRIETMTITASLNYTVSNSTPAESLADIRTNAPQQYYTQNRMITGEDYNILPFSLFNSVVKVKATNRVSSGVSRFLDVLDVTGKYSSTNIFCDDGYLYKDDSAGESFSFSFTSLGQVSEIIYNQLIPILLEKKLEHFRLENSPRYALQADSMTPLSWLNAKDQITNTAFGVLRDTGLTVASVGLYASATNGTNKNLITEGAMIKFVAPPGFFFTAQNTLRAGVAKGQGERNYIYAAVLDVDTTTNIITINQHVPNGAIASLVIMKQRTDFAYPSDVTPVTIGTKIRSYQSFGIRYDDLQDNTIGKIATGTFKFINANDLSSSSDFSTRYTGDTSGQGLDASWLIKVIFDNNMFTVTYRGLDYVFESTAETTFYYDTNKKVYDSRMAKTVNDIITILKINTNPDDVMPIGQDIKWQIYQNIVAADGYQSPNRVLVTFPDSNNDGIPDDPDLFSTVVNPDMNPSNKLVFFKQVVDSGNRSFTNLVPVDPALVAIHNNVSEIKLNAGQYLAGQLFYSYVDNAFYVLSNKSPVTLAAPSQQYSAFVGRPGLSFQYQHVSPNDRRIDPSPNNIMDLYILTKQYATDYAAWIQDTSGKVVEPMLPTTEELSAAYSSLDNYKALSDTIIYNTATFKPLFGKKADVSLRATFKVVPNPNIVTSESEVKSAVIAAINTYFDINNWDFGETFYFSELSAYLHQTLTPMLASIIIVPADPKVQFGNLYQINAQSNEIITSAATVENVEVITAITAAHLNQTVNVNATIGI